MGCLRNLARTFRAFIITDVDASDVPAIAIGGGCEKPPKIALLPLKEGVDKPLRELEDYLNEMLGHPSL